MCTEENYVIFSDEVHTQIRCPPNTDISWPRPELGHLFRWPVQRRIRSPIQMKCTLLIYIYSRMHIYPGKTYPPWIKPRATEPDYPKTVSDIAQCTYTQVRCTPQIELIATQPDYTKSVSDIAQCTYTQVRHTPLNQTHCYRAQLHQISFWYSTMHMYPEHMYHCQEENLHIQTADSHIAQSTKHFWQSTLTPPQNI